MHFFSGAWAPRVPINSCCLAGSLTSSDSPEKPFVEFPHYRGLPNTFYGPLTPPSGQMLFLGGRPFRCFRCILSHVPAHIVIRGWREECVCGLDTRVEANTAVAKGRTRDWYVGCYNSSIFEHLSILNAEQKTRAMVGCWCTGRQRQEDLGTEWVPGQPSLHWETLSQKTQPNNQPNKQKN